MSNFFQPEGEDELKRRQLMELAIINGTYRPASQGKITNRKINTIWFRFITDISRNFS